MQLKFVKRLKMNYPILSELQRENAPWNDKEQEVVNATISCSFSFQVPLFVNKNSECNIEDFNNQYIDLEDFFKYLYKYFKVSETKEGQIIKDISKSVVIDEVDINYD